MLMREFDLLQQPLRTGTVSLIEASAGSGKTTAIENLFIRLLLEGLDGDNEHVELEIKQILVVTFTEAATAELVDRVRRNIFRALELLHAELTVDGVSYLDKPATEIPDVLLRILVNFLTGNGAPGRKRILYAAHLLRVALSNFDEAAISTIHGFCSRMLNEFTFESGAPFGVELIADDRAMIAEAAADYWRNRFYAAGAELRCAAASLGGLTPDKLSKLGRQALKVADVTFSGEAHILAVADAETELEAAFRQLRDYFDQHASLLEATLRGNLAIFKADFRRDFPVAFEALSAGLQRRAPAIASAGIDFFNSKNFADARQQRKAWTTGDGLPPPLVVSLLTLCEKLKQAAVQFCLAVKFDFIRGLRGSNVLKAKKRQLQVQSFDDLLTDMRAALKANPEFAARIRRRFKVALIDEFQDTDPAQYDIFRMIFQDSSTLMLMVGDPKQSIYAFRGADIYSYLQVAGGLDSSCRSTLNKNYRSSGRLLAAFNTFFGTENPFVEPDIKYQPAECGREPERLEIEGEDIANFPLRLWQVSAGDGLGALAKKEAAANLCQAVAAKIAWMLNLAAATGPDGAPRARFEKIQPDGSRAFRALKASDIAVLTDSNLEARQMREALAKIGVPGVLQNSGNVFTANEAAELYHVLCAAAGPGRDSLLRTALATAMFGLNGAELELLDAPAADSNTAKIEFWRRFFLKLNSLWRERGFAQMFFRMLREEEIYPGLQLSVREKLLALPLGERRLTDLLHLGELLHQASRGNALGMNGLIAWLHERILRPEEDEEHEQRLESDDEAVKIMTVHKSKGLQFPVVFCPFCWNRGFYYKEYWANGQQEENDFFFHSRGSDGHCQVMFETGGDEEQLQRHRLHYRREKLAEALRLLYVALTRAKQFCCVAWGNIKDTGDNALMYLSRNWPGPDLQSYLALHGAQMTPGHGEHCDKWKSCGAIKLEGPFAGNIQHHHQARQLPLAARCQSHPVPHDWGIISFSSLASGVHAGSDQTPGWDEAAPSPALTAVEEDDSGPESPLAGFPAGPVSGNCIHEIFEEMDFTWLADANWRRQPAVSALIKDKLLKFGRIDNSRPEASLNERSAMIAGMLENVLHTPLPAAPGNFRLTEIPRRRRVSEMEFFFQLQSPLQLNKLLGQLDVQLKSAGGKSPLRGFMNGKLDLFFEHGGKYWIADWKTNCLGHSYRAYTPAALADDMAGNAYLLQAGVYVLAVNKFLKFRKRDYDYDRHFGGVFYLYVRGMDGRTPEHGIFSMRPDAGLLRLLEETFQ